MIKQCGPGSPVTEIDDWICGSQSLDVVHPRHEDSGIRRPESSVDMKILLVDDCALFRECLVGVLAGRPGGITAVVAWDLPTMITAINLTRPQVILLNSAMHDSPMLLRQLRRIDPNARVVVTGVSEDDEAAIVGCAEAGVVGYHMRNESLDELLTLIDRVAAGESPCSPRLSGILLRRLSALAAQRHPASREVSLTTREIEILRMLEAGMANREIADRLCIAVHTVKNHVHSVLTKLGVSSREQAAALARDMLAAEDLAELVRDPVLGTDGKSL
ncbi:LuxR C-terminal-related transcriptional regulator [Mycobacterium sp. pV006]|uniref:LuxR C-terminal-related transcriptional regulator n=1 Tax=Mycobacterium sp. pV006 TaxID=3238983 RepID=UPI00351AFEF2